MKVKVNLVKDKPKRKLMNHKDKKFENSITNLPSNLFNLPPSTQNLWPEDRWKILLRLRENQSVGAFIFQPEEGIGQKLKQEETEEMIGTRSTWWNWTSPLLG